MKVRELQAELERENPEDEIELWVTAAGDERGYRGYTVGQVHAGDPGKVEIQTGEEID